MMLSMRLFYLEDSFAFRANSQRTVLEI